MPTLQEIEARTLASCLWCGKPYAEHAASRGEDEPVPRMPCQGLKSGFRAAAPPAATGLERVSPPEPQLAAEPTRYTVNAIPKELRESPAGRMEAHLWDIHVERASPWLWAVRHGMWCLSATGSWHEEPQPSSRSEKWLAAHRFPLEVALDTARLIAPDIIVNGNTPEDFAEWCRRRREHP